eukprot:6536180-Alexandrium_andersonii.AAC.1
MMQPPVAAATPLQARFGALEILVHALALVPATLPLHLKLLLDFAFRKLPRKLTTEHRNGSFQ